MSVLAFSVIDSMSENVSSFCNLKLNHFSATFVLIYNGASKLLNIPLVALVKLLICTTNYKTVNSTTGIV